jgi:hypothetical protein
VTATISAAFAESAIGRGLREVRRSRPYPRADGIDRDGIGAVWRALPAVGPIWRNACPSRSLFFQSAAIIAWPEHYRRVSLTAFLMPGTS